MIGTTLKELMDSAQATLPSKIALVSSLRSAEMGGTLEAPREYVDWWQVASEKIVVNFPAFGLAWDPGGTLTGQRDGTNGRKAWHKITATFTVRSADKDYIRRHMLYFPEAFLLWVESWPTASRAPGTGKTLVGLANADGKEIEFTHDLEGVNDGSLIWSVDASFTVLAKDSNLPPRTT